MMSWKFFFLSAALVLSTSFSAFVIWLSTRRWSNSSTVHWTANHRTYVQIIVQIISNIIGASQTFILNNIIAFSTNIRMLSRPTAIDTLKLRHVVTTGTADFDLPHRKIAMSLFWLMLIQIPSLLWTGSSPL